MVYNNKKEQDSAINFYFTIIHLTILQTILTIVAIDDLE